MGKGKGDVIYLAEIYQALDCFYRGDVAVRKNRVSKQRRNAECVMKRLGRRSVCKEPFDELCIDGRFVKS